MAAQKKKYSTTDLRLVTFSFRLSPAERKALDHAARLDNRCPGSFVRNSVIRSIQRVTDTETATA